MKGYFEKSPWLCTPLVALITTSLEQLHSVGGSLASSRDMVYVVLIKLGNPHLKRTLYMVELNPKSKFLDDIRVYPKFLIRSPIFLHSR